MTNFFKQKEQKPFAYPSIEIRKSSRGYYKWTVVITILVVVLFIFFLIK